MGTVRLYLALSCLQGRPMQAAAEELLGLGPHGLQLTPGNAPTPEMDAWAATNGACLVHHGFSFVHMAVRVWSDDGRSLVSARSVHPPRSDSPAAVQWRRAPDPTLVFETMYPGYELGDGDALDAAMADSLPLAVDVSHVFIQRCQGAMSDATWLRLQRYDNVREVHVSANRGRHDTHDAIRGDTFGLAWARERASDGVPLVLESYMHRMTEQQRRAQVALVLGET